MKERAVQNGFCFIILGEKENEKIEQYSFMLEKVVKKQF